MTTRRGLSVLQGTALTLGALLGTGIVSLPAIAAQEAGPASLVAWGAMLLLSIPLAATFAALGARHPDGGGVSTYARLAFGDRVSTMLGWALYFAIPVGAPVAAGFAAAYVADLLDQGRGTALVVTAAIIVLVATLNWCGVQVSATVQLAIAGVIALVLVITVAVALPHAEPANLTPFAPDGVSGIGAAAAVLVWAFAGWEIMASLSAEYDDPGRDIARAAVITLVVIGVLYLGIAYATVAVLGPEPGDAPLSALLVLGFGEAARPAMTVIAVLLTVGAMNSYFAGAAHLGASLGRDGALPAWLGAGAAPGRVPRRSLAVTTVLALGTVLVMAASGAHTDATLLVTTGTFALVYLVGAAAAVRLLPSGTWARRAAVVSLVASVGLVLLTGAPVLAPLLLGVAGLVWAMRRRPAVAGAPAECTVAP